MKKFLMSILCMGMLAGCAAPSFETLGAIPQQAATTPEPAQMILELPESAAEDVFGSEEESLYICGDYSLSMQTAASGDLKATVKRMTGFDPEQLNLLETASGDAERYDFVWTGAGEQGDMIGRAAIIDDGTYHYCLWVLGPAEAAGSFTEEWDRLFSSFYLESA